LTGRGAVRWVGPRPRRSRWWNRALRAPGSRSGDSVGPWLPLRVVADGAARARN